MKFKVFVSYSSRDLKNVQQLNQRINESDIDVFVADHSVPPGEKLSESITRAINECDVFIVLWSKNAKASDWVSQEIGHAYAQGKKILPLVLKKNLELPGFIRELKFVPVYKNSQEAFIEVRDHLLYAYQEKQRIEKNKNHVLVALGVFLFWLFNQS